MVTSLEKAAKLITHSDAPVDSTLLSVMANFAKELKTLQEKSAEAELATNAKVSEIDSATVALNARLEGTNMAKQPATEVLQRAIEGLQPQADTTPTPSSSASSTGDR